MSRHKLTKSLEFLENIEHLARLGVQGIIRLQLPVPLVNSLLEADQCVIALLL